MMTLPRRPRRVFVFVFVFAVFVFVAALRAGTRADGFTPPSLSSRSAPIVPPRRSHHRHPRRRDDDDGPRAKAVAAATTRTALDDGTRVGDDDDDDEQLRRRRRRTATTRAAIRNLMAEHDPILLFASNLLPPSKATDASALYAWCRRLDEICDDEEDNAAGRYDAVRSRLDAFRDRFEALWADDDVDVDVDDDGVDDDERLMDLALRDCVEKYNRDGGGLLTRTPFDDMIEGMRSDAVEGRRIETMDELELYAYRRSG